MERKKTKTGMNNNTNNNNNKERQEVQGKNMNKEKEEEEMKRKKQKKIRNRGKDEKIKRKREEGGVHDGVHTEHVKAKKLTCFHSSLHSTTIYLLLFLHIYIFSFLLLFPSFLIIVSYLEGISSPPEYNHQERRLYRPRLYRYAFNSLKFSSLSIPFSVVPSPLSLPSLFSSLRHSNVQIRLHLIIWTPRSECLFT